MMQTNLQLDLAFNYLENTGTNIFLTGKAGTGNAGVSCKAGAVS